MLFKILLFFNIFSSLFSIKESPLKYEIIKGRFKASEYNILKVKNENLEFVISKPLKESDGTYYFKGLTGSDFLSIYEVDISLNTSPFKKINDKYYPLGLYIYNGELISEENSDYGNVIIKNNKLIINPLPHEIKSADYGFSSFFVLLKRGERVERFKNKKNPLVIMAKKRADDFLYIVNIEGRNIRNSAGITLNDAVEFSLKQGFWDSVNLDGGISSTIVIRERGEPKLINLPATIFGIQRKVPFHLGIKF